MTTEDMTTQDTTTEGEPMAEATGSCSPGRRYRFGNDSHLRASNEERDAVISQLSTHFAEGRLDDTEFHERLGRATSATTRGELNGLFDDLPRINQTNFHPRRRHRALGALLLVVVVAASASWFMSFNHFPWVVFLVVGILFWSRTRHRHYHHDVPPNRRW